MTEPIKVVVADDHPIVRQGVVALRDHESDINVVAEVADGRAAVSAALVEDPDVILMDLRMPGRDLNLRPSGYESVPTIHLCEALGTESPARRGFDALSWQSRR